MIAEAGLFSIYNALFVLRLFNPLERHF